MSKANLARKAPAIICQAGDTGLLYCGARHLGWRPCTVLAVVYDRAVVEFVRTDPVRLRPAYTALAFIDATRFYPRPALDGSKAPDGTPAIALTKGEIAHPNGRLDRGPGPRYLRIESKPATYLHLPLAWLQAIVHQSGTWEGRSSAGVMPMPEQLMRNKLVTKEAQDVTRIQAR